MNYVTDASVAIKWVLAEVDSDKALRLRDAFRNAVHHSFSVDFFPYEVAHALTRAERQKRIGAGDAWNLWKSVMADCPGLQSGLSLMQRATEISSQLRIGIYDCLYVALAEMENCEFVTADDKLIKHLQTSFPFIVALTSLP